MKKRSKFLVVRDNMQELNPYGKMEYFELISLIDSIVKIRGQKKPQMLYIPAFKIHICNDSWVLKNHPLILNRKEKLKKE